MVYDHPDFWSGVIPGMPSAGVGQIPWYQSDEATVAATDTEDLINYVVPDDYELHVCAGLVSCDFPVTQRFDLRQTPAATWVSPTSHSDPDSDWLLEEWAYDNDLDTRALNILNASEQGNYLILLVNEVYIDKVRFYAFGEYDYVEEIDIDVYYGGAWVDVYSGAFTREVWTEKNILAGAQLISKARVRFKNGAGGTEIANLNEFQINTAEVTPQKGIYFDINTVIPYQPQAPYVVEVGATFAVRVYNDDGDAHTMSVALAGFLQKKA